MILPDVKRYCKIFGLTAFILMVFWFGLRYINKQELRYHAQKEYEKFLALIVSSQGADAIGGESDAVFEDMEVCQLIELLESRDGIQSLYCDIDGDGISELHIRSANQYYYILKYEKSLLKVIYCGSAYQCPVNNRNLCGVLYYRCGGAPTNETYYFTKFNRNGQETGPEYQWYDINDNNVKDEGDIYLRDDAEQSRDVWLRETESYREYAESETGWGGN